MYMMSFMTLGIFWIGQQTQLNHLARSDRSLSWIHMLFLFRSRPSLLLCLRNIPGTGPPFFSTG